MRQEQATIQPFRSSSKSGRSPSSLRVSAAHGDTANAQERPPSDFSQQIFAGTRSNCLHHERCSGGCMVVLAVVYALLAVIFSSSKPGAAARPVGIYDPYDAQGCTECVCHSKERCEVRISVARQMKRPLMLQFQLESFYQNHRRYVNSVSYAQLSRSSLEQQSSALDFKSVDDDCAPLVSPNNSRAAPPYDPCGVKAASLFNDHVQLYAGAPGWTCRLGGAAACRAGAGLLGLRHCRLLAALRTLKASLTVPLRVSCEAEVRRYGGTETSLADSLRLSNAQACANSSCAASELRQVKTSKDIAYDFGRTHRAWRNTSTMTTGRAWLYDVWRRAQAPPPSPPPAQPPSPAQPPPPPNVYLQRRADFVAAEPGIEDFVSWMRASPLPTLRKPLLRIEQDLSPGEYVLRVANRYDARTFHGTKSFRVSPYSTSLGGDPATLVAVLVSLCVASLLLAAAVAAATHRSSQPARCEALLQELHNAQRQDKRQDERRRQSMCDAAQRPSTEWLGAKKPSVASASSSSSCSASSCVSLPIDAANIPDSLRRACLGGPSAGGSSASHSSLPPLLRGSLSGPTAASGKRRGSPGPANPGLRKLEDDAAATFERHRTREDEILARYAPGARAAGGQAETPPPPPTERESASGAAAFEMAAFEKSVSCTAHENSARV